MCTWLRVMCLFLTNLTVTGSVHEKVHIKPTNSNCVHKHYNCMHLCMYSKYSFIQLGF